MPTAVRKGKSIKDRKSKEGKILFTKIGTSYEPVNETTLSRYLESLKRAIEDSRETVDIINESNAIILKDAKATLKNAKANKAMSVDDIGDISSKIASIISNQQELFKIAEKAPKYLERFKEVEQSVLSDEAKRHKLFGNKIKYSREDPPNKREDD